MVFAFTGHLSWDSWNIVVVSIIAVRSRMVNENLVNATRVLDDCNRAMIKDERIFLTESTSYASAAALIGIGEILEGIHSELQQANWLESQRLAGGGQ